MIKGFSADSDKALKGEQFELEISMPEGEPISDDAIITINDADCPIVSISKGNSSYTVVAKFGEVAVGSHKIIFNEPAVGTAVSDETVTADAVVASYSPTSGSEHGGTRVTVNGRGFSFDHVIKVFAENQEQY